MQHTHHFSWWAWRSLGSLEEQSKTCKSTNSRHKGMKALCKNKADNKPLLLSLLLVLPVQGCPTIDKRKDKQVTFS